MNKHSIIFLALDTHKEFHEVAYCEEQRGTHPVHYGRIPSSKASAKKPGKRIKTGRRDALKMVKLLKSEDLTPMYVQETED